MDMVHKYPKLQSGNCCLGKCCSIGRCTKDSQCCIQCNWNLNCMYYMKRGITEVVRTWAVAVTRSNA